MAKRIELKVRDEDGNEWISECDVDHKVSNEELAKQLEPALRMSLSLAKQAWRS